MSETLQTKVRRLNEFSAEHQARATAKSLEHILQEAQVDDSFAEQCMQDCWESALTPARVAVVGTSNAGKTALANALLGQLLASSDSVPNTVLPVEYVLTEEASYSLNVGGKGLKELLTKSDLPSFGTPITRGITFRGLKAINDEVRKQLHGMQSLAELTCFNADAADLQSWHVRISVPRDKHVSFLTEFVLIDCPGGSEKADSDEGMSLPAEGLCVGMAIRAMLRWQIERSTMVICATRTEKMESMRKRHETHALFGGQPPLRRRGAFVINAIDDEDSKTSAVKYLRDNPSILSNLEPLQIIGRTFFVSARSMLSYRLCSKVFPSPTDVEIEPESTGQSTLQQILHDLSLSEFLVRLSNNGIGNLEQIRGVSNAEFVQSAMKSGLKQLEANAVWNRCNAASNPTCLHEKDQFEDVWENPALVDELKHICQNVNMPPKLARTVMCGSQLRDVVRAQYHQTFSNNVALHKFFTFHLSNEWPQILCESLVNRILQRLFEQKNVLQRQLELQQVPTGELRTRASELQQQIEDELGMRENIMSKLRAKLPIRSQVNDACDWLSKKDFGAVPPMHGFWQNPAPQALAVATAYKENATWGNRHAASGEMRVTFKTKQRLQDFVAELQRWIARTVAAVFGDGDEGEIKLPEIATPPADAAGAAMGFEIFTCGHELTAAFWNVVARDTTAAVLDRIGEPKLRRQLAEAKQTLEELMAQLEGRLPLEASLETEISRICDAEARIKQMPRDGS